jgi:regulator of sigma E protease
MGSFILFILVISLLVTVHEFGHFIASILLGIRVDEFAIGFGPALIKKEYKGILFRINAIPLGGYVRVYGQEERKKGEDSYSQRPVWQRFLVLVAGAFMNFLLASFLFYFILGNSNFSYRFDYTILDINKGFVFGKQEINEGEVMFWVPQEEDKTDWGEPVEELSSVKSDLPEFGIIETINNEDIENQKKLVEYFEDNKNEEVNICGIGGESQESFCANVEVNEEGKIGIYIDSTRYIDVEYTGWRKMFSGFMHSVNLLQYQNRMLGRYISLAFKARETKILADVFSGPVAVYQTVDAVAKQKDWLMDTIKLSALVSLNLAFVNMLPIPVLDGGYIFFLIIELIRGRKMSEKNKNIILLIGMIFIIALSLIFLVNDILRYSDRASLIESIDF